MDNDYEGVRTRLMALGRAKTRKVAIDIGLNPETIDKFRRGHIKELGGGKLMRLMGALDQFEMPTVTRRAKVRA